MEIFYSAEFIKYIDRFKSKNDSLAANLIKIQEKIIKANSVNDLYEINSLGFKKYKGTKKNVYGIDFGLPGSSNTAGERIIATFVEEFEKENKEFKLLELDKEKTKYRKLLNDIKEDYKKNYITKEEFELFKDRYLFELNKVLLEKESLNSSKINNNDIESLKKIKKLGKFDILDRNIIHELIEVIYITEDGNVDIHFKYKDLYEDTLRYLKQNMV